MDVGPVLDIRTPANTVYVVYDYGIIIREFYSLRFDDTLLTILSLILSSI